MDTGQVVSGAVREYATEWALVSIAFIILAALPAVMQAVSRRKPGGGRARRLKPLHWLFAGFFCASLAFLAQAFAIRESPHNALAMAASAAMRIFIMDGNVTDLRQLLLERYFILLSGWKLLYATGLYICAPILTLSVILSMISGFFSYLRYLLHPFAELFVFSELNSASIALAEDLQRNREKGEYRSLFVYCGVDRGHARPELLRRASCIGAVVLKQDILQFGLRFHDRSKPHNLLFCSALDAQGGQVDDSSDRHQAANMEKATEWLSLRSGSGNLKKRDINVFVFSSQDKADLYVESLFKDLYTPADGRPAKKTSGSGDARRPARRGFRLPGFVRPVPLSYLPQDDSKLRVTRVNVSREIVYNLLDDYPLFTGLHKGDPLHVLVVGGSRIAEEFVKAVCWCGQLERHGGPVIHVVDGRGGIRDRLWTECPDLMRNNETAPGLGDGEYCIRFHDFSAGSGEFHDFLRERPEISYVLVSLEDDDLSIRTAANIRTVCTAGHVSLAAAKAQAGQPAWNAGCAGLFPAIHLVVENDGKSAGVAGFNYNDKQRYHLNPVGSVSGTYRKSVILHPLGERQAFLINLAYSGALEDYGKLLEEHADDLSAFTAGLRGRENLLQAIRGFRGSEYNRRSSYAFALHMKYKLYDNGCLDGDEGGPGLMDRWHAFSGGADSGAGLRPQGGEARRLAARLREEAIRRFEAMLETEAARSDTDIPCRLSRFEHRRWNAYTRTEGFLPATPDMVKVYCGPEALADHKYVLARLHPTLVPWEDARDDAAFERLEKELSRLMGKAYSFRESDLRIIRLIPKITRMAYPKR